MGSSEYSGFIQYIPDSESDFARKIAAQLDCRDEEFWILTIVEFGGEDSEAKSKLKTAPEFFGADLVVAVLHI
jgi:hypothetical protein